MVRQGGMMEVSQVRVSEELIKSSLEANYDAVSKICYPLFKNTPIKSFDYGRYYDSGEMINCGTFSPELVKMYYTDQLYPSFEELKLFNAFGLKTTFLSHAMPLPPGMDELNPIRYNRSIDNAANFHIFHRLYFVQRHQGFFTAYGFGLIREEKSLLNFYLNALKKLEDFIKYFEYHASALIENAEQNNRVILPHYHEVVLRDCEKLNSFFDVSSLDFSIESEEKHQFYGKLLTKREVECLEFIAQGYTMKNIAKKLKISDRTVETHLRNIKDKYGLHTKNQLVEIWHTITKI